jgi:CrcB protein
MKLLVQQYLAVAGAGALGAVCRLMVASVSTRLFGGGFPIGTLLVNLSGSLALGWFLTTVGQKAISETTRLAVAVGFVGAYTTFSTLMYESVALLDDGAAIKAVFNLAGSLLLGLLAVRAGMWLASH